MIRVLIADDHAVVREGLALMLASDDEIKISATASSGAEALEFIRKKVFDVVLMDMSMPGMNGLEALKQIKAEKPRLPVLLFSVHPEEQYALRCIKAGAAGYLNKSCKKEELIAAVRRVSEGKTYITPSVSECMAGQLQDGEKHEWPHQALSDREYEVFELMAKGKAPGDIAKKLSLSPKTVSTYRERILEKMGLENNASLMRYAFDHHLVE